MYSIDCIRISYRISNLAHGEISSLKTWAPTLIQNFFKQKKKVSVLPKAISNWDKIRTSSFQSVAQGLNRGATTSLIVWSVLLKSFCICLETLYRWTSWTWTTASSGWSSISSIGWTIFDQLEEFDRLTRLDEGWSAGHSLTGLIGRTECDQLEQLRPQWAVQTAGQSLRS